MSPTSSSFSDLAGKVVLVTGASRGIGEAVALGFAATGARLVLASRKIEGVSAVAETIKSQGGEALALACHTGKVSDVEALAARARETFGGVDVVVNNAATNPHYGPLLAGDEAMWDKTFEVNVKGYANTIRACLPMMRERGGGAVVNVASIAGLMPHAGLGIYGVSKAAVIMMTKTLAIELARENIRVNAIAPGLIQTRFSEALWTSPEARERALKSIPQRRIGQPEDLVGAVLYLASDAARFTTGAVLVIDGGQTLTGAS